MPRLVAADGLAATNELRDPDQHFNAVLMDIHMLVMDGYTATRTIREEIGRRELPVIAVTADALPDDIEKTRNAGMIAHLIKPIDISALLAGLSNTRQCRQRACGVDEQDGEAPMRPVALPIVDLFAGLKIFNGNKKKYVGLLQQFVITYHDGVDEVRDRVEAGDPEAVIEILHGVSGAARFLQIRQLAAAISALIAALR